MSSQIYRAHGRASNQMRPIKISSNIFGYAAGSVLFELGNTKVLCAVSLQPGVPPFLKGTKTGWLTAEYSMLPTSGHTRLARESATKRNDRAIEISRLIGRSLRSIVNLAALGERTIHVDCDVLQADGSTRTAAITGAGIALQLAVENWLQSGDLTQTILTDAIVALSVGFSKNGPLLDIDFSEDSSIDCDYNFVLTPSGKIIEIQGTAEKNALSWPEFEQLKNLAISGAHHLIQTIAQGQKASLDPEPQKPWAIKSPMFSLKNRLSQAG